MDSKNIKRKCKDCNTIISYFPRKLNVLIVMKNILIMLGFLLRLKMFLNNV